MLLFARSAPQGPPALCPLFSWYPLACVKGSLPFDRSLWHGPSLRRTGDGPSVASARRAQETRLAAPSPEAPRTTPKRPRSQPAPDTSSSSQPPAPHLRRPFRAYILGYTPLSPTDSDAPPRASAPAAAGASRPLALRRGQAGSAPLPRRKSSAGADLFRRPYLGTTAFFIPLTLSMAYRTASMVWLSWSGYRGRTCPLRSRSYS